jgi:drug/metabolite transporter (DMT)-like permease
MLASVLTTILFSISVVCATRSAKLLGGTEANFWRLLLATVLLGIWAHAFGQGLSGDSFPLFLFSGIIGVGADVFLFQALPRIGSRLSLLIVQCFSAMSAAAAEWIWLGTKLTVWQIAACLTILAGVAVALAPGKHLNATKQTIMAGIGFGLLAAFGNGMGAVISRKAYAVAAAAHQNIDGATGGYQRLIGGLMVAAICLLVVRRREVAAQFTNSDAPKMPSAEKWRRAWPWVFANSFAGQTLGVTCYQWALKTTPTGLVLAIIATTPLIVIPFSVALEGEKIETRSIAGGAVAVAGALFLLYVRSKGL